MATSSHDGGGATGEGKSLGARRARLNQLKADPLPSARPPPPEIVFGIGHPARRLRGRAALGPSPISSVDSRAAVDRGATLPPVKKGGRGRLRQVAVDDESLVVSVEGVGSRSGCRGREPELLRGNGRSKTQTGRREASPGAGRRATQRACRWREVDQEPPPLSPSSISPGLGARRGRERSR